MSGVESEFYGPFGAESRVRAKLWLFAVRLITLRPSSRIPFFFKHPCTIAFQAIVLEAIFQKRGWRLIRAYNGFRLIAPALRITPPATKPPGGNQSGRRVPISGGGGLAHIRGGGEAHDQTPNFRKPPLRTCAHSPIPDLAPRPPPKRFEKGQDQRMTVANERKTKGARGTRLRVAAL
jgi:hypothetical protein